MSLTDTSTRNIIPLGVIILFLLLSLCFVDHANAIDGYDYENNTRVTITGVVSGDSIQEGEQISVYIWNRRKQTTVTIDSMTQRGNDIELQVTETTSTEYFFFDILADDPGLHELPHFDPGLPPPVPLSIPLDPTLQE